MRQEKPGQSKGRLVLQRLQDSGSLWRLKLLASRNRSALASHWLSRSARSRPCRARRRTSLRTEPQLKVHLSLSQRASGTARWSQKAEVESSRRHWHPFVGPTWAVGDLRPRLQDRPLVSVVISNVILRLRLTAATATLHRSPGSAILSNCRLVGGHFALDNINCDRSSPISGSRSRFGTWDSTS